MSQVVTLTAQDTAERLLPVIRDFATKLAALNERAADILPGVNPGVVITPEGVFEAARLVCLRDTLERPVTEVARHASGLLEHAELEQVVWVELKLRLDELEEHLRFSKVAVTLLKERLAAVPKQMLGPVRKLVEETRLEAPF